MVETNFCIASGRLLPARILSADLADGVCEITIEVGPAEWQTVDMVMLFHLKWGDRHEGQIVEGGDVRIDMRLDPVLVRDLEALTDGADVAELIAGLDPQHPLKDTEAWYGLRVTEAVPLPPQLADKGEVRSGFTTIWNDV